MVGDSLALGQGQFGGADVHALVELHRIAVDDFGLATVGDDVLGDFDCQRRFAGTGWADYRD